MFRRLPLASFLLLFLALSACRQHLAPQDVSIAGLVPPLSFSMRDVNSDKPVTAEDFRGKIVLLYFGYTNCPDICPATLYNAQKMMRRLGPLAVHVVFLFVTVDPDRDTPPILSQYVALFGPNVIGLRGTPDQLFRLARRYRVVFSVNKPTATTPYEVTHSSAVYVFDTAGAARFIVAGMESPTADIDGTADDVANLLAQGGPRAWLLRLLSLLTAA
jgi:protein SCO1/2